MAKIELSLESNINLITSRGFFKGFSLSEQEVGQLVARIVKNFYSPHGSDLASAVHALWNKTSDRDMCHRLLTIAYDIESYWRSKNKLTTLKSIATSQHAFEQIPLGQILSCPKPTIHEIQSIFKTMHRADFEKTRYWQTIRSAALSHFGFTCQASVGPVPCGAQSDLYVVPRTDDIRQGTEHDTFKDTLTVLCERHKLLYVGRNPIEWESIDPYVA